MHPAVFLDRDDTLIACNELPPPPPPGKRGDLVDPALVRPLPGVLEGLTLLTRAGFTLVVVSNQGCVARGAATLDQVRAVNERVQALLNNLIHAFYFCPFHPQGTVPEYTRDHPWRKPHPGMILEAARDHALDLSHSWLIGDAPRDVESGINAGLAQERCLLIAPTMPAPPSTANGTPAMPLGPAFATFLDAARHIVASVRA